MTDTRSVQPGDLVSVIADAPFGRELWAEPYSGNSAAGRRRAGLVDMTAVCTVLARLPHPDRASSPHQLLLLLPDPIRLVWSWDIYYKVVGEPAQL